MTFIMKIPKLSWAVLQAIMLVILVIVLLSSPESDGRIVCDFQGYAFFVDNQANNDLLIHIGDRIGIGEFRYDETEKRMVFHEVVRSVVVKRATRIDPKKEVVGQWSIQLSLTPSECDNLQLAKRDKHLLIFSYGQQ